MMLMWKIQSWYGQVGTKSSYLIGIGDMEHRPTSPRIIVCQTKTLQFTKFWECIYLSYYHICRHFFLQLQQGSFLAMLDPHKTTSKSISIKTDQIKHHWGGGLAAPIWISKDDEYFFVVFSLNNCMKDKKNWFVLNFEI